MSCVAVHCFNFGMSFCITLSALSILRVVLGVNVIEREMSGDVVKRKNMEEVGVRTLAQEPCVPHETKSQR